MEKMRFIVTVLMTIGAVVLISGSLLTLIIQVVRHIIYKLQINKHSV